jgi:ABC-type amino acid transport substrate-binding protein
VSAPLAMRALLVVAALLTAGTVRAEDDGLLTGTLKTIRDRGTILVGVRADAAPFSFRNKGGQPVGFSVDLCHGIAEDAAAALNRELIEAGSPAWQTGVRIEYVPVPADARLQMVASGAVDIECSSTTANAERSKTVAFSPVFFLAGTKLLVPADASVPSYRALAGKTVAVNAGTTNAAVVHKLAGSVTPPIVVTEFASLDAAYDALAAGRAQALASDDILLIGEMARRGTAAKFRVAGDYLSYEPYAITIRKDDPDFATLVQRSFGRMAADGVLRSTYDRWFMDRLPNGERLGLPMSAHLSEMYRGLGQPD